ncbi:MAG: hypothetical protein GX162_10170 [Firmicutes bacterium]|jgi:hypothetical protein|nr:hypothetical protein [Bacillota bacterium]
MLSAVIVILLLVVIVQLQGLRRLLEKRLGTQQAQPEQGFANLLHEELDKSEPSAGWRKLRDEVKRMAAEGQTVTAIAQTLGVGQGEVQLLLDLEEKAPGG